MKGIFLTEYNKAEQMELFKEDGRREGRAEGRVEGEGLLAKLMSILFEKGLVKEVQACRRRQSHGRDCFGYLRARSFCRRLDS